MPNGGNAEWRNADNYCWVLTKCWVLESIVMLSLLCPRPVEGRDGKVFPDSATLGDPANAQKILKRVLQCFSVVFLLFFLFFFVIFFRPPKLWDNRSRERLNGVSWNFHQTIGGNVVWNVVPPLGESRAAAWRMLMLCVIYDDSFAVTRGRHVIYATTLADSPEGAGGCVIQQLAGELM